MNRNEFLKRLEQSLEGQVARSVLHENLVFYEDYIIEECKKGASEQEVLEILGDPRLLAKTIIEAEGLDSSEYFRKEFQGSVDEDVEPVGEDSRYGSHKVFQLDLGKWYWRLLGFLLPILFFVIIFLIFQGILTLLIAFSGPLLMILFVFLIYRNFIKK